MSFIIDPNLFTPRGQADSLFVDAALSMGNSLRYVAVEPSEKEVEKFKALVESKKMEGHWSNATFDFHPITVQQYLLDARKTEERQHFDIISCPESAYFFTDAGEVFAELYQLLNKGGILLNTMCGGAWEQLTIEVAKYFPSKTVALPGSSTLREILQKRLPEVDFQVVTREYSLDVGECFQEGSRVGNMLLDFFVQILDFRKDAPKEVVDKIMAFMDENCSRTADGKRNFVVCEEDIIISRKH
ncbi:histamine N-methyltransferase B-like isoform X2 [Ptychodera flava]|uniref:histamine N-methyltransferase B-like isoform X2 n=1 Tax=Ptychodera flava TaxID=63121 RepID=UPI00396A595E